MESNLYEACSMANLGNLLSERSLTRAEIDDLPWGSRMGGPTINDIRMWHHQMARLLAMGASIKSIADTIGKTYNRVWLISKDPMMMELAAEYLAEQQSRSKGNFDYIVSKQEETMMIYEDIRNYAANQLRDSLEDIDQGRADKLSASAYMKIISDMSDRSGLPKVTTNININTGMDARLELANIRSNAARKVPEIIELKPLRASFLPPVQSGAGQSSPSSGAPPSRPEPMKLRRI